MGALAEIYIKKETLETILKTLETKSEKGISITLSLNDKSNDYGQNVSSFVSQNKEQREAKKEKFYVGNGKVFWSDGKITVLLDTCNLIPLLPSTTTGISSESSGVVVPPARYSSAFITPTVDTVGV